MSRLARATRTMLIATVYVSTTALNACGQVGTSMRFTVEEGKQYCEVLTLPTPWAAKSPGKEWLGYRLQYRWPREGRGEILVKPEPQEEVDYTTVEKLTGRMLETPTYRITLSHPVQVSSASAQEWNAGIEARRWPAPAEDTNNWIGGGIEPDLEDGQRDPREFRYLGRLFDRSGQIWAGFAPVLFSPAKRYVALQSWDGWYQGGKTSHSGHLYIDLYDARSGNSMARIHGKWSDWTPDGSFSPTAWLTENDLILPFDWDLRSILLCHIY